MTTPYAADDLQTLFEAPILKRGRSLVLIGAVEVALDGDTVVGAVADRGLRRTARLTPSLAGRKVVFQTRCTCKEPNCPHLAASALAALDRFPVLRRPKQATLLDSIVPADGPEPQRLVFDLSTATPPDACTLAAMLVGERTGRSQGIAPAAIAGFDGANEAAVAIAGLMGTDSAEPVALSPAVLAELMPLLLKSGLARWSATGRKLISGSGRIFDAGSPPPLPRHSALLLGEDGPWYIDAATGVAGPAQLRQPAVAPAATGKRKRGAPIPLPPLESDGVISDTQAITPLLRLQKREGPDDIGQMALLDTLALEFDYGGTAISADDERQFIRNGADFIRRDMKREEAAAATLAEAGFVQLRVADKSTSKGRRVLVFRGPDAAEAWHRFLLHRVPVLRAEGWRCLVETGFGPRTASNVGPLEARISDAERGSFALDLGIEIDGVRVDLLPILARLMERGGVAAAEQDLVTSLPDGRVVHLPADRIRRLLSVLGDLMEASTDQAGGTLILPQGEVAAVLELQDLLTTRWQDASEVAASLERFREAPVIESVPIPDGFTATLRPYQQHGLDWLQHLRAEGVGGFLADEMGLGKTAQTIAHIAAEWASGRMVRPALVVVPTSLVSNWVAELGKFTPHFRVVVLHGQGRDDRRERLDGVHVVLTTYTVLARDIEAMAALRWHVLVLDEAQAIKSPDAKATRAVCQLEAEHRVCLSGTPIENNLDELWSQFAFLMPGLLGERRSFSKRFRMPIEKEGDSQRRDQLARRIRPFILRRTKAEVAAELPPKHTILRRITLNPEQRELYETIRATLHDSVRATLVEQGPNQGRFVVLNALLKLRQACCDPRLVKLASGEQTAPSSKLDTLMEMITGMIPEGRKILVFSQFTTMLDLMKPRLAEAGIGYVELRGDTRDRAEPVRAFQAGETSLFLISLKAGGRGLNLTAADTVIHYDPWWNPAAEDQASDRAHRIGQTKSVFVYKLIASETVEERIVALQERKAELAGIALDGGDLPPGLDLEDFEFLTAAAEPSRRAA